MIRERKTEQLKTMIILCYIQALYDRDVKSVA